MRQTGWRVNGPYKHGRKWRVVYTRGSGAARETEYDAFDTRAEADACIEGAVDVKQGFTIRKAVDAYLEAKRERGLAGTTIENYEHRLWRLLGLPSNCARPVRWVGGRGSELYAASVYGAGDTHINGLNVGRMWGAWCVKKRILKSNPFEDVEALRRRTGHRTGIVSHYHGVLAVVRRLRICNRVAARCGIW